VQTAISTDTLIEGRHFLSTVSHKALGHKALAVNLSDLAACGAAPVGFLLSLTLPKLDERWLDGFSEGLLELATEHSCALIGGNTTAGPLAIGITVIGEIPLHQGRSAALLRSGAKPGDDVWVSGWLGQARAALEVFRGNAHERMEWPVPRVELGQALRGVASAAIDVSDGFVGDFGHLLRASGGLGLDLDWQGITPILVALNQANTVGGLRNDSKIAARDALNWVLNGGDDYELAFTAPPGMRLAVEAAGAKSHTPLHRVGRVSAAPGARLHAEDGRVRDLAEVLQEDSFDHFA
jgi:thiamine-monophosphate kinase